MPYYLNPSNVGVQLVSAKGDGNIITLKWHRAFPNNKTNLMAYNIYMDTVLPDFEFRLFDRSPTFVSVDGKLTADISGLTPGQMYRFGVRPVEFDINNFDLRDLPTTFNNLRVYPESPLREDISTTSAIIPLLSVDDFPPTGTVRVGAELIQYSSVDTSNNDLLLTNIALQRGFNGTEITFHNIDGYDGYKTWDPTVLFFPIDVEDQNTVVFATQDRFDYPHYAFTVVDGYRQNTKDIVNADLSISDQENEGFPSYDYAGWNRIDPVALLNGECVGSYFGGQNFCADGYDGVGRQLRGQSVQDTNTQRQEVLLSLIGEPVCLVKRQTTGIRCFCVLATAEQPDARCHKCFIPGTLVRTENGFKPIETIRIGDKVLSSDGFFYKVTKTMENDFNGSLQSITTSSSPNPILTTPEHPFMVLRGSHSLKIKIGCGPKCNHYMNNKVEKKPHIRQLPSGRWHARVNDNNKRYVVGTFDTYEEALLQWNNFIDINIKPDHILEWDDAQNIKEKDWLVSKWSKVINDIDTIEIPEKFRKNTKLGIKRNGVEKFIVDEEFMWIIGLYLAEGSAGTRSISFALHREEIEYQERVLNFFKKYGFNGKIFDVSENGVSVLIYSTSLSLWFADLFGKKCYNKHIPELFMKLSMEKTKALIDGIFSGDGGVRDNEVGQTSEILALQLIELLHKIGKKVLSRRKPNKKLTPKGNKRKDVFYVNWENENPRNRNRRGRWEFENELLTKVKKVEQIPYNGKVYNLEVEGDHTYIVQDILVHNCYGTGYVVSYNQYFDSRSSDGRIKMKFDPWVDSLPLVDSGLSVQDVKPNAWTLVLPAIKTRDFIVRFDSGGNEEFRYEVINVTRNALFTGPDGINLGAQKLSLQRIRKTDIIYMVPVFRDTSTMPLNVQTSISSSIGIPPHFHSFVRNEKHPMFWQQLTSTNSSHNHTIKWNSLTGLLEVSVELGHSHTLVY